MKNLFTYIAKKNKRKKVFFKSEEYRFFVANRHSLMLLPENMHYYDNDSNQFQVMRANIIIHSFINKSKMEEDAENLAKSNHEGSVNSYHDSISSLPYFQEGNEKIYLPIFSRALNQRYLNEPEKLLTSSYTALKKDFKEAIIDPFDTYGSELYNSSFSHLVKIASVDKETAFFHEGTSTIYFVNEQGRLDASIVLFDRYCRHPNYTNLLERIKPVIEAYFAFDRDGLIDALYNNHLISARLFRLIKFHDWTNL